MISAKLHEHLDKFISLHYNIALQSYHFIAEDRVRTCGRNALIIEGINLLPEPNGQEDDKVRTCKQVKRLTGGLPCGARIKTPEGAL